MATASTPTADTGFGLHMADLPTSGLTAGSAVRFTFRWPEAGRWEDADFMVRIGDAGAPRR